MTTKHIGLIQIDGSLPNLALMKLSSWHRSKGDKVRLLKDSVISQRLINFDKVYISCIFEENKEKAIKIQKQFKNAELGGIGVNSKRLPVEIEHTMPDYETFDCNYSLGFTTRGCIRKCKFCKVPRHEGLIRPHTDIYEFWNRKHKHIVLLDNNILASPEHFKKIAKQILKEDLSIDFNQGLDIRLIINDNAKILSSLNVQPEYRFAFDDISIKSEVLRGIKTLKKNGINRSMFYVIVGFNSTIEEDMQRLNLLKEHGQRAYVMRYKSCKGKKIYNDLSAWVNQTRFFMSMDFERFVECRENRSLVGDKK